MLENRHIDECMGRMNEREGLIILHLRSILPRLSRWKRDGSHWSTRGNAGGFFAPYYQQQKAVSSGKTFPVCGYRMVRKTGMGAYSWFLFRQTEFLWDIPRCTESKIGSVSCAIRTSFEYTSVLSGMCLSIFCSSFIARARFNTKLAVRQ